MVPEVTHLQYAVLSSLAQGEMSGKDLRACLDVGGVHNDGPSFYQMMSRLEGAGLVSSRYVKKDAGGRKARHTMYSLTSSGITAKDGVCRFMEGFSHDRRGVLRLRRQQKD